MKWGTALLVAFVFVVACVDQAVTAPARVPVVKPLPPADLKETTKAVKAIFEANCVGCHGGPQPKLFDILNVKELGEKNILQGKADSRLYKALNRPSGWMPLGEDPLSIEDKQTILIWLENGWPAFEPDKPVPSKEPIQYKDEVGCIAKDVTSVPLNDAYQYRYLTLSSYWNLGQKEELDRAVEAVTKLLNSVSFSPHIEKVTPVDCKGIPNVILRLRLDDFNLEAQDWDNFLVEGKYPYYIDYQDDLEFFYLEQEIAKRTYAKTLAYIRGDWFVSYISKPPLYYRALFKKYDIKTTHELEKFLNVNTFEQLFKTYEARRALFRRSGVTNYNRIVDRYNLDFWIGGTKSPSAYWKSYDTLGDKAQEYKNLFAFPFGPLYTWYESQGFFGYLKDKVFQFDANEMIWTNPNGTLGFFLANGKEQRIDEALTEVAHHQANYHPYMGSRPGVVIAGVSCFACHSGMQTFSDEGLKHIKTSVDFSNNEVDYAKLIFWKDTTETQAALKKTNELFAVSQKAMGAKQVVYVDSKEPIFATAKQYFYDVDICQLAAEFGFTCDDMKEKLAHSPELARLLGLSETLGGRASRLNVEHLQAEIVKELNLGKQVLFSGSVVTPPPVTCKLVLTNNTQYPQRIDRMAFTEKTYGQNILAVGQSVTYEHDSAASMDGCLSYNQSYCVVHKNLALKKCGAYEILRATNGYSYVYEKK